MSFIYDHATRLMAVGINLAKLRIRAILVEAGSYQPDPAHVRVREIPLGARLGISPPIEGLYIACDGTAHRVYGDNPTLEDIPVGKVIGGVAYVVEDEPSLEDSYLLGWAALPMRTTTESPCVEIACPVTGIIYSRHDPGCRFHGVFERRAEREDKPVA